MSKSIDKFSNFTLNNLHRDKFFHDESAYLATYVLKNAELFRRSVL
jgi:hypothetical protein